jgi:hypothetical protein
LWADTGSQSARQQLSACTDATPIMPAATLQKPH